jgi:NAD(P)-dependent dehydrogenase (short-subunit alcohol dehydrogenase family)
MVDNEFTRKWLADMTGGNEGDLTMASIANMETVEPEVIADTVAWLVADSGKHITGVALPVDDGYVNKR